jgi:hypothetical protein
VSITERLQVSRATFPTGATGTVPTGSDRLCLRYIISGSGRVDEVAVTADDTVRIEAATTLEIVANEPIDALLIRLPATPSYTPQHPSGPPP